MTFLEFNLVIVVLGFGYFILLLVSAYSLASVEEGKIGRAR